MNIEVPLQLHAGKDKRLPTAVEVQLIFLIAAIQCELWVAISGIPLPLGISDTA